MEERSSATPAQAALTAAVVGATVFAVPAALAAALWWWGLRRRVRRAEAAVLAVTASVALVMVGFAPLGAYLSWAADLLVKRRLVLPPAGVLLLAAWAASALAAVSEARLVSVMPMLGALIPASGDASTEVIPSLETREAIAVATKGASPHTDVRSSRADTFTPGQGMIPLGVDARGAPVGFTEEEFGVHGIVLGSTGSGKTVTLTTMAAGAAEAQYDLIVLDLKMDLAPGGFRDFCRDYAAAHDLPYQELVTELDAADAPSGPALLAGVTSRVTTHAACWFNILEGMSATEAFDAVMSMVRFDDEHWQTLSRRVMSQMCNLFYLAHHADPQTFPYPNLYDLGMALFEGPGSRSIKNRLGTVIAAHPDTHSKEDFQALLHPTEGERSQMSAIGAKLTNLYETPIGRAVLRPAPGRSVLRLGGKTGEHLGVTYIGVNTSAIPDLARAISTAVLVRLNVLAGQVNSGLAPKRNVLLMVDEANRLDMAQTQNLLSRARSSGISMWLSTQGPRDWGNVDGKDWWPDLSNNANAVVVMAQHDPVSAELAADYLGQVEREQVSERLDATGAVVGAGLTSRLAHIVAPEQLRQLGRGEAVIRVSKPYRAPQWLRVQMRRPSD